MFVPFGLIEITIKLRGKVILTKGKNKAFEKQG